jgi:hypothetical protein
MGIPLCEFGAFCARLGSASSLERRLHKGWRSTLGLAVGELRVRPKRCVTGKRRAKPAAQFRMTIFAVTTT